MAERDIISDGAAPLRVLVRDEIAVVREHAALVQDLAQLTERRADGGTVLLKFVVADSRLRRRFVRARYGVTYRPYARYGRALQPSLASLIGWDEAAIDRFIQVAFQLAILVSYEVAVRTARNVARVAAAGGNDADAAVRDVILASLKDILEIDQRILGMHPALDAQVVCMVAGRVASQTSLRRNTQLRVALQAAEQSPFAALLEQLPGAVVIAGEAVPRDHDEALRDAAVALLKQDAPLAYQREKGDLLDSDHTVLVLKALLEHIPASALPPGVSDIKDISDVKSEGSRSLRTRSPSSSRR